MNRRSFLKLAGIGSLSIAAGCTSRPDNTLYTLVNAPDDMVTGRASWYATTCRECPAGCGAVARVREGRVVKLEGNPLHPINRGTLCMRGHAALQGVYNPDRVVVPRLRVGNRWEPIPFARANQILRERTAAAAAAGDERVRMLTEVTGETLSGLMDQALSAWGSGPALAFEPLAYESLKTAHRTLFGIDGLFSYRINDADFLISLGADFLETFLSPVEYARQFKAMHGYSTDGKGAFVHLSPAECLTAANADRWISVAPGAESAVALCLLREALAGGRGEALPAEVRASMTQAAAPYTFDEAARIAGVGVDALKALANRLPAADRPLVLGAGPATVDPLKADFSAILLNLALDPALSRIDFSARPRVETAARRAEVLDFFKSLDSADVALLYNVNPVYALPPSAGVAEALRDEGTFVVAFSAFMDETAQVADLVFPVRLPLELWDEYGGRDGLLATLQPAMGRFHGVAHVGDVLLETAFAPEDRPAPDYRTYLVGRLMDNGRLANERDWVETVQHGGKLPPKPRSERKRPPVQLSPETVALLKTPPAPASDAITLTAAPSLRLFDGRGANRPWLCEIPDPLTKVAWGSPVRMHPDQMASAGLTQGDLVEIASASGTFRAPVYETAGIRPGVMTIDLGWGHYGFGRYADGTGVSPLPALPAEPDPATGGPRLWADGVTVKRTGRTEPIAHTDGSRYRHGRSIALTVPLAAAATPHPKHGLAMHEFPLVLPLPEGYDPYRDVYPPHDHDGYRWAMVVDTDRCIGCGACAAACYAENNVGVVGRERMIEGREMSWLAVQRYLDDDHPERVTFLPMMCQHCDNAPCESVCPVYAPHHSKEGLNNQIYNRCIGTRFCSQNCPYKVRRFNWFDWSWPEPLNQQLNPEVTARSKGVMEKCSFCVQRIKDAHGVAAAEGRAIADGEVTPACVQTCPTGALTFGSLMDDCSRVARRVADPRAYQVLGYLNTKPAVIYLKKVVQEI